MVSRLDFYEDGAQEPNMPNKALACVKRPSVQIYYVVSSSDLKACAYLDVLQLQLFQSVVQNHCSVYSGTVGNFWKRSEWQSYYLSHVE